MDDLIIAAIRRRLKTKLTDLGQSSHSRLKPAKPAEVSYDETRLGFPLPPLLKRVYTEIGNGGFGPGYGLIGLTHGAPDDTGKTATAIYEVFRSRDAGELKWPVGLLPICHWGCGILSCVDCIDPDFRIRIFDPNVHEGDDWADTLFEESAGFAIWIRAWASGVDLWELMYGERGHVRLTLTARWPMRS